MHPRRSMRLDLFFVSLVWCLTYGGTVARRFGVLSIWIRHPLRQWTKTRSGSTASRAASTTMPSTY